MEEEKPCENRELPTETTENVLEREKVMKEFLVNIKEASLEIEEINVLQLILQNFKNMMIFKNDGSSKDDVEFKRKTDKKSGEKTGLSVNEPVDKLNLCKTEDDTSCAKSMETKQTNQEIGKEPKSEENSLNELEEVENCHNGQVMVKMKKASNNDLNKLHNDIEEILMNEKIMSTSSKCSIIEERVKEDLNEPKDELSKRILKMMVEKSDYSRKKIRKRKNMWKKAKKGDYSSKMNENKKEKGDEEFELRGYVEHDKKYFFVHSPEISCKLCSFKGKLIVQHYKTSHPESEVLISRINPNITEILIEDAIQNREEYDNDHPELEKITRNFKCPFCLMIIKDTVNTYYNHISSHTGEYCFHCNHCSYWTYNYTNINSHLNQMHYKSEKIQYKMIYLGPKISKYVFGYICSECNFIQLIQKAVEEHAMVYHPGTPEIYKVNLDLLLYDDIVEEDRMNEINSNKNHSKFNSINTITPGPAEMQNHNLKIPAEANKLTDLLVQIEEQEEVKVESKKLDSDPCPVDLATFICQPDLDIKQDSDSNRMQTLQWIKENARIPKTTTSELQTKLVTELIEESQKVQADIPSSIPLVREDEVTSPESLAPKTKHLIARSEDDTVIIPEQVNLKDPSFINHVTHLSNQVHLCDFEVTDSLLSSTSAKLTNRESEVSLPLLPPPTKDTETDSDQSSVSLDEPEAFNVLVNDEASQLDESDHEKQPKDSSAHNDAMETACKFECKWKSCYQTYRSQTTLVKHIEKNHVQVQSGKEFTCFWINCRKKLKPCTSKQNLSIHMRIHSGEKPYKCPFPGCNKAFSQLVGIKSHEIRHTGERPYLCQFANCFKSFTTRYRRDNHQMMHYDPDAYACLVTGCSKKYTNPITLRKHMEKHTVDEQFESKQKWVENKEKKVDPVLKKSSNRSDRDEHQRTHYNTCKWKGCHQTYHSQIGLVKHIKKNHIKVQNGKKFTCSWINCPRNSKRFADKRTLLTHMRTHSGEKPYKCSFQGCNKAFSQVVGIKTHERRHTGEKPYLCQFSNCRRSFSTSFDKDYHQKMHYDADPYARQNDKDHLQTKQESVENKEKKGGSVLKKSSNSSDKDKRQKTPYDTCKWKGCYEAYDSEMTLVKHIEKEHVRLQKGEEVTCFWINCPRKLKPYTRTGCLLKHIRVHTGGRPYKCPKVNACRVIGCSKKYAYPNSLRTHMKNHTVDKQLKTRRKSVKNKQKKDDFVLKKSSNSSDEVKHQRTYCITKHSENHIVDKDFEVKQKLVENDFIVYHL